MNTEVSRVSVQVIMKEGRPEWAVMPYAEYEALLAKLESLEASADKDCRRDDSRTVNSGYAQPGETSVRNGSGNQDTHSPSRHSSPRRETSESQDRKTLRNNLLEQLKQAGQVADSGKFNGAKMTILRKQKGMDDAYVAREIGISPVYLKQIEDGERQPSEPILRNIARALGVDVSELS